MLWRIVAWIVLIGLAWWAFRDRTSSGRRKMRGTAGRAGDRAAIAPPERMLDCARCGLHLPASEALRDSAGQPYCCEEHRAAGPRARG